MKTVILITILNLGAPDEVRVYNRVDGSLEQCQYAIATRPTPPNARYRCVWIGTDGRIRKPGPAGFRADEFPYAPRG